MKIRMNLLPYREARRKEIRQQFWFRFGLVAAVGLVAVGGVHMAISGYISKQEDRNRYIVAQNKLLDERIKEIAVLRENIDQVKSQQEIIAKLQSDRAAPANMLEQMVKLVPDGMYITKLAQKNSNVVISGLSQSSDLVSDFMSSVQSSEFLSKPELIEIKAITTKENRRFQQFSLKFVVRSSQAESDKAASAKAQASDSAVGTGKKPIKPAIAPENKAAADKAPAPEVSASGIAPNAPAKK